MARFYCEKVCKPDTKSPFSLLLLFGALGLISGIAVFLRAEAPVVSLMRRIVYSSVSIASLFSIYVIPFLFTAFAVYISKVWILLPVSYCKAFAHSFVSCGIFIGFGSAGWIIRALVLFADSICLSALYLLWKRFLTGQNIKHAAVFSVCLLAGVAEYYIFSPFLADLIEI